MKIINRLPRPATVIACAALVASLGGTAFAATELAATNSVGSASIRDGDVYSRDIHNRTIKGVDVLQNSLGSMVIKDESVTATDLGPASVGADELGPDSVSADELGNVFIETATSAAIVDADGTNNGGQVGHGTATVTCPAGTRLLSGGARWVQASGNTLDANVYLQESARFGDDGWRADGIVDFGAQGNIRLQVEAYCLGVPS